MAGMCDSWGFLTIRRQVFRKEKNDACCWNEENKGKKKKLKEYETIGNTSMIFRGKLILCRNTTDSQLYNYNIASKGEHTSINLTNRRLMVREEIINNNQEK